MPELFVVDCIVAAKWVLPEPDGAPTAVYDRLCRRRGRADLVARLPSRLDLAPNVEVIFEPRGRPLRPLALRVALVQEAEGGAGRLPGVDVGAPEVAAADKMVQRLGNAGIVFVRAGILEHNTREKIGRGAQS